jgi:cytochrome c peroxidase
MSEAKAELGRHLFYDTRLSGNGTQSCATCHEQERAFTDGRARAVGSTGEVHPRGSMSLVNVGYAAALTWGNPTLTRLEDQALVEGRREGHVEFHNTGLYNAAGALSYPPPNTGIYEFTKKPEDVGKFKAPTLRNIAVTAPYMHDGSIATLEDVLAHYAAGGRTIASGPYQGIGHDNPNKSPTVRGFPLSPEQRDDLIAFLRALTDESVLHDPRLSNPWRSAVH